MLVDVVDASKISFKWQPLISAISIVFLKGCDDIRSLYVMAVKKYL